MIENPYYSQEGHGPYELHDIGEQACRDGPSGRAGAADLQPIQEEILLQGQKARRQGGLPALVDHPAITQSPRDGRGDDEHHECECC
ncbi:MAG: hypothetical protein JO283_19645 [Bradyrhizobium sp.]|nr:hypothetical protein [Bradyrhizobium sp.]